MKHRKKVLLGIAMLLVGAGATAKADIIDLYSNDGISCSIDVTGGAGSFSCTSSSGQWRSLTFDSSGFYSDLGGGGSSHWGGSHHWFGGGSSTGGTYNGWTWGWRSTASVPEPGTFALFGLALLMIVVVRRWPYQKDAIQA